MPATARIALVAGEASGDQLGAALIRALREIHPDAEIFGIGGERMRATGFEAWWDIEELSLVGLFEVVRHLPRLLRLRRALRDRLLASRPDVVVGIDAPDFNLGLERQLRKRGLTTVHYVSPTVWAWRPGRVRTVARAADLVLCLFPFEPDFYQSQGVAARYTGHPLADSIPLETDRSAARAALGLPTGSLCIALLPGSRVAEVERLAGPMLDAAERLAADHPGVHFVLPLAGPRAAAALRRMLAERQRLNCRLLEGRSQEAMSAADVVVCASGTATMECLLVNRPMVVVYRVSGLSWRIGRAFRLLKTPYIALPNLLAREKLVPEFLQDEVSGQTIATEVERWLGDADRRARLRQRFQEIHQLLRRDAARTAAEAIDRVRPKRRDRANSS